jgi:hypothetical protein
LTPAASAVGTAGPPSTVNHLKEQEQQSMSGSWSEKKGDETSMPKLRIMLISGKTTRSKQAVIPVQIDDLIRL